MTNEKKYYYFQLAAETHENWETIPAIKLQFLNRSSAAEFAKHMADSQNRKVRITDNEKLMQGSYFHPPLMIKTK